MRRRRLDDEGPVSGAWVAFRLGSRLEEVERASALEGTRPHLDRLGHDARQNRDRVEAQTVTRPGVGATAGQEDDRRPQGAGRDHDLAGVNAVGPGDLARQAAIVEREQSTLDADRPTALEDDAIDGGVDQEPRAVPGSEGELTADAGLLGPDPTAEGAAAARVAAGRVAFIGRGLVAEGMAALDEQSVLDRDRTGRRDPQVGPHAGEVGVRVGPIEALESVVRVQCSRTAGGASMEVVQLTVIPPPSVEPARMATDRSAFALSPRARNMRLKPVAHRSAWSLPARPTRLDDEHRPPGRCGSGGDDAAAGATAHDDDVGLEIEHSARRPPDRSTLSGSTGEGSVVGVSQTRSVAHRRPPSVGHGPEPDRRRPGRGPGA